MATQPTWVTPTVAAKILGITRKELFVMRDDGTLKLGTHYRAFPETRSRASFRYNISKVQKQLAEVLVA